ncbi:MAG: serine/threonine protein kinase, partial [Planctomycetes bacterium]|nr:serine/threonine protein kinase [Planctomycetota bacterium]
MADEELIDNVYKLVMCVASGNNSQVWEVAEQPSGRPLAMKLLKSDSPDYKDNKSKLKAESTVLKTLDHPLIVKFDKYSTSRDNTYMTMEYFRAPNVKLQLKSNIPAVHARARKLFEGVCSALSHVHSKGWIHRDVKPDNVLLNKAGEIRLVDFSLSSKAAGGFAKMIGGGKQKMIQGTRTYIAPETILKRPLSFQTDLYSLGIMFFEVLTGRTPFQAASPDELLAKHLRVEAPLASDYNPNVSPEMDRIIAKLLKKKPIDRHASVDDVLGELRRSKIFKEDITEEQLARKAEEEKEAMKKELTDIRLDSRADAKLQEMLQSNPELAVEFAAQKKAKAEKKRVEEMRRKEIVQKSGSTSASPQAKTSPSISVPAPAIQPYSAPMPQPPISMPIPMPMPQMPMPMPPIPMAAGPVPGYPVMPPNPMPGMPGVYGVPNVGYPGQPGFPGGPLPSVPQPQRIPTAAPPPAQAGPRQVVPQGQTANRGPVANPQVGPQHVGGTQSVPAQRGQGGQPNPAVRGPAQPSKPA